ncbi:MAG: dienelactone hydrolase family protein [Pusillimonas sp.]
MPTLNTKDNQSISAFRAGQGNGRGLVLLQEIFGVNAHIRETAERFASEGFDVVAPALFDRVEKNVELDYSPESVQRGLALRAQIPLEHTLLDIEAAIETLKDKPTFIIGYCWGGTLSWHAACKLAGLAGASCWYPGGIGQAKDLSCAIPVQVHFGETDTSIPLTEVEAFRQAQPDVSVHVYEGAGHGFGCDQRGSFNQQAYELARDRTLAFFASLT